MIIANSLARLEKIDWDYLGDQSESPFASIHFHPGRFISQIPATLIGRLTKPGDLVLDPYCGSGTTLIEAQRLRRRSIGIDANPVSVLISRAKLLPVRHDRVARILQGHLRRFLDRPFNLGGIVGSDIDVPSTVQLSKWYHPDTGAELREIWFYISQLRGVARTLFEFAFSSILMPACSETRHWGYVCDNTRPLEFRYIDAIDLFRNSLAKLEEAYASRDFELPPVTSFPLPRATVFQGDSGYVMEGLKAASVDLVVTSPPYYGVVDYVKSQRLSMEWFGKNVEEFRALETGARSKRHRTTAYVQYLNDIERVLTQVGRLLKSEGVFALLIGQSDRRKNPLPDILSAAHRAGLVLQHEFLREIAHKRRQAPSLTTENLYLFCKASNCPR